jgi:hypothetical protein
VATEGTKSIDARVLARAWTHAHEEDGADTLVFRPSEQAFPPSRGRRSFSLHTDGTLSLTQPGATDAPRSAGGRWSYSSPDGQLRFDLADGSVERWAVVSADGARLVLRR